MKTAFITSSLEPGRDGVGDYTRRLAGELIRQGHATTVVAINDSHILETRSEVQESEGASISVLRLSQIVKWSERIETARKWLDDFDPDWVSLQFVPFGFHPKGLCFRLGKRLASINTKASWHIMFHELWVGMDEEASTKLTWWGLVQREIIYGLLKTLTPKLIHTQTKLYQVQLQKLGYQSDYLPLFGNIPVNKKRDPPSQKNGKENLTFVVFGSIHHGAPIEQFAKEMAAYAKVFAGSVKMIFIGRSNSELKNWAQICRREELTVEELGEQKPEFISQVLSRAAFGISSTPLMLADKSGGTAAMLEHELPVICVARQWRANCIDEKSSSRTLEYSKGNLEGLISKNFECFPQNDVQTIAENLLNSFTQN